MTFNSQCEKILAFIKLVTVLKHAKRKREFLNVCCNFLQQCFVLSQARLTQEPVDLEGLFEEKLAELQRGNTADSLKQHDKYTELEEHIQNAIQSADG